jgi:hypothetical protein
MQMRSDHKKNLTAEPRASAICYDELGLLQLLLSDLRNHSNHLKQEWKPYLFKVIKIGLFRYILKSPLVISKQ